MQAVILAAGKSTRTRPLTLTMPKPLLKITNRTLLEHNLDNLCGIVDEAIVVVGYKKDLIKRSIGSKYKNIRMRYVEQKQQLGTGHAALLTEPFIKDRFILMAGDDVYSKTDISNSIRHRYSILVNKAKNWKNFGVIIEKGNILADFVEKPDKFVSDLINTAFYVLDKRIFLYLHMLKKSSRNEYEFPDALKLLSKHERVHCVRASQWLPIAYPWDMLRADMELRGKRNIIGKNSKVYGKVINSTIGDRCVIKGNVKDSLIMDDVIIDKGSAVECSVIGEKTYFRGKILAKNNATSLVNNKKIKVSRLGAIIADNSRLADVVVHAGCKISPGKKIEGRVIRSDVR